MSLVGEKLTVSMNVLPDVLLVTFNDVVESGEVTDQAVYYSV
jgi:hypothetical protein